MDAPAEPLQFADDGVQQRRLAAADRSDHADQLAPLHLRKNHPETRLKTQ